MRAIIAPMTSILPLDPILIIFGLLLLALLRQWITILENAQLRRRWAVARANEQAMQEIKQQMETFLGIAAHELKTPLTVLTLHYQLAERRFRSVQQLLAMQAMDVAKPLAQLSELYADAHTQLARLSQLVNDFLDASQIQEGRLHLHRAPMDLGASVRAVVEAQRQLFPDRIIGLDLPAEGTVPVSGDAARIEQVVTNYLTNALKYSPHDCSVEVGMRMEDHQERVWVRISLRRSSNNTRDR
jgi:signal transduction histidine kinase